MKDLPVTVRRSLELLGLCALALVLITGKDIIMPLLMAFFISLLMLPLFRWLQKVKVPEVLAILICILVFFVVIGGVAILLSFQIGGLVREIGTIENNLNTHWNNLSGWISRRFHMSATEQLTMIRAQGSKLGGNVASYLQNAVVSLSGIFIFVGLLPIYVFLILFYRNLLLRFIFLWFNEAEHMKVKDAVDETQVMVKYYLLGLMIQIGYLTLLVGGILLLFGIPHAILIAVTFAILNLIPYLGALVGNVIGVLLTLTSSQELSQIWIVLATIAFVQFLDNNILMPRIVGSKVKVNALASIVGIIIGGSIAGVVGMFLSIPLMAVLKIIFDKAPGFKKWGVLLGDARPNRSPLSNRLFRIRHDLESKRNKETVK